MNDEVDEIRALPPQDAYRLWASRYHEETAVTELERHAVDRVTPVLAGRALLDAGCGTGRRLDAVRGAARRVGVDLVPDMILAGIGAMHAGQPRDTSSTDPASVRRRHAAHPSAHADSPPQTCAADLRALPLRGALFDIVWCRLVLGHMPDPAAAYAELSRVAAARRATLIVTDFHPAAAAAGHTRSFRDEAGIVQHIQHHIHSPELHIDIAQRCGWRLRERADLLVGAGVRRFYEDAGAVDRYREQLGTPLVLMLVFLR